MASYEIAVMAGILGTAWIFLYASKLVNSDDSSIMNQIFKIFLMMMGFVMLFFIPPAEIFIIDANNGSTSAPLDPLRNMVITQTTITNYILYLFVGLFIIYLLYLATATIVKYSNKKKGGGDELED